jgi:hypothetical protein
MNEYSKLILVGTVLLFFGVPLVTTTSYKIFFDRVATITSAGVLPIQANSSAEFLFWHYWEIPKSEQISVVVAESPELQNLLDPTLNYNSMMNYRDNITISIDGPGNHNISASMRVVGLVTYERLVATHTFDIPSNWDLNSVRVTNPENYPVCWIVTVVLYGQLVDNTWRATLVLGIGIIILGLVVFRIANVRRNKLKSALDFEEKTS